MGRISRFSIAKKDIVSLFDKTPQKVYTDSELSYIFEQHRDDWRLAKTMSLNNFIENMVRKTRLKKVKIGTAIRYVYHPATDYEVILTLHRRAYFSHYTAVYLHQLTEQLPKTIYLTSEQAPKIPDDDIELMQSDIDKAFSKPQRKNQNSVDYKSYLLYVLNGKHTDNEGVITMEHPKERFLRVTSLERTLIDIVVRPAYSGGIGEILSAYEHAKERVSINKLNAMLGRLRFLYPYHQAIGFYLEKAGYREPQVKLLRKNHPFTYDFYLSYDMEDKEYSKKWRLYYPKGF